MQKAKLTSREQVVTALLGVPLGIAVTGLLMWGMEDILGPRGPLGIAFDVAMGLVVSILIYRHAERLNQPRRTRQFKG